jgi:alanyl-tRNA synthetase
MEAEQMQHVEEMVNADIAADLPVYAATAPQEEALKIHGLHAVFGEKYPPRVRVVSIGASLHELLADPGNTQWYERSVEFCGGTHLPATGAVGGFVIVSEEAVSKGVRRLTAVAGDAAAAVQAHAKALLGRLDALREAKDETLAEGVTELTEAMAQQVLPVNVRAMLRDGIAELQKRIKEHHKSQSQAAAGQVVDVARMIAEQNQGPIIVAEVEGADADSLRTAMDVIRKTHPQAALLLATRAESKVAMVASVPPPMINKGLKAGDWVRETAKVVGGGGGGRPDMAQAGGKDPEKLPDALDAARRFAASKLG